MDAHPGLPRLVTLLGAAIALDACCLTPVGSPPCGTSGCDAPAGSSSGGRSRTGGGTSAGSSTGLALGTSTTGEATSTGAPTSGGSSTGGGTTTGASSSGGGSTGGGATTGASSSGGGSTGAATTGGASSSGGGAGPDGGCPAVACSGQPTDTCSDPANCGGCGNVCGSCAEGCLSGVCADLPTAGLVAYFKFDEGQGAVTHDSSPSGLVGTVSGSWTAGYQASAIQYDGQSTYVLVQDAGSVLPSGNAPRSVSAWIYLDSGDLDSPFGTSGDIVQMGYGNCVPADGNMFGLGATPPPQGAGWILTVWGGCDDYGSGLSLPPEQWLFVGATFDGSHLAAYVNDQSESPDGGMAYATTPGEPMYVGFENLNGSPNDTGSGHFAGIIDELRVYDRALSPAEMNELYRGTRPGLPLDCGGACTNGDTDPANCGACSAACAAGQTCSGGSCQ
ncbi:MAG TPA: LamG-like jellyroll fold domain-containing protein [Myxococcales bacterium]|nr:LamG-like jellyroll fold domain-containing protein [Myxococcales bacterium]